jgi:hypothetical protein
MIAESSISRNVRDGLEKLAAHGDHEHIRTYLAENNITGNEGCASACVIAEYLIAEGFVPAGGYVTVKPGEVRIVRNGLTEMYENGFVAVGGAFTNVVPLPLMLAEFACKFDHGAFPELSV